MGAFEWWLSKTQFVKDAPKRPVVGFWPSNVVGEHLWRHIKGSANKCVSALSLSAASRLVHREHAVDLFLAATLLELDQL